MFWYPLLKQCWVTGSEQYGLVMAEAMSRATLAQAWTASQAGVWAASVAALQHAELDGRHALQEEAHLRRWEAASPWGSGGAPSCQCCIFGLNYPLIL